ncbi:HNH endonuclease family protein [Nocardiopsis sp. FIRDI 009]|uniref:HNH endonuclease family protein n=1 Tax=Nocardiopsis sp. FIRDI 009 TaxID=714197 RepID=UPI000E230827|nr:HNH endonuclease family protein [Nocardiopsis sp. FIRDI 009]
MPPTPRTPGRVLASLTAAVLLVVLGWAAPATADHVLPPGIPSTSTAQSQLHSLTVAPKGPQSGYDRSLFPHWVDVQGTCSARQVVLLRDGHDVVTDSRCQPTSGRWWSSFDATWVYDDPSRISVDHMVPLSEAWKTGARHWSTSRRRDFANDVNAPQLWPATPSSNSSKGDDDPSEWMPPNTAVHCDYVKAWVNVKYRYDLTVTRAERSAIQSTIDTRC